MDTGTESFRELPIKQMDRRTSTSDVLVHAARQARDRHYEDYLIIDVDAHHFESESWKEVIDYIQDPVIKDLGKSMERLDGTNPGSLLNAQPGLNFQNVGGRIPHSGGLRGEPIDDKSVHRDVILARRAMENLGIDYQVIFPTPMLGLGLHPQPNLEIEISFAYNRWLTERILSGDDRLTALIYLPMCDPEAAMKTVEEFGDKKGVVGFNITSVRHKPVHYNQYMKLYRAIEERGLTLGFHAGPTWEDEWTSQLDRFIGIHAISFVLCNLVHMTNWVLHGLPERFPKLPVMWIESGLAWVPFMMQRLDNEYLMRSSEAPLLKRLPSEYMREMYYTSQPIERTNMKLLQSTFEAIKADTQLLYASDWPHWDFDAPSTIMDIPFLTEQAKRNILGLNANRLFKLDLPKEKKKFAAE